MRKLGIVFFSLLATVFSSAAVQAADEGCRAKVSYIHVSNDPCYSFRVAIRRKHHGTCPDTPCKFVVNVDIGVNGGQNCNDLQYEDTIRTPAGTDVVGPFPAPAPSTMVWEAALACGVSVTRDMRARGGATALAIIKLECTACPE